MPTRRGEGISSGVSCEAICARPYTRTAELAIAKQGQAKGTGMGAVNWLGVLLGTLAFFAVGAVWYGALFGKAWQHAADRPERPSGAGVARIMVLTLVCEFLIVAMLGHLIARTSPSPRVVLMMGFGFGATIIAPALGLNYLHQRRPLALFLIDAGHVVVGLMAAAAVFIALA